MHGGFHNLLGGEILPQDHYNTNVYYPNGEYDGLAYNVEEDIQGWADENVEGRSSGSETNWASQQYNQNATGSVHASQTSHTSEPMQSQHEGNFDQIEDGDIVCYGMVRPLGHAAQRHYIR